MLPSLKLPDIATSSTRRSIYCRVVCLSRRESVNIAIRDKPLPPNLTSDLIYLMLTTSMKLKSYSLKD